MESLHHGAQVWSAGDAARWRPIREVFKQVDPNFAITSIQPMRQQVLSTSTTAPSRALSGLFGSLALLSHP